jgi:tRNA nucleotidyltransferase (CCA-adding enzyme)
MTADDQLLARLAAAVPPAVREVCDVLTGAGFEAVTVGGAVRDVLLGRVGGDWDVATSAHPDEVVARFARTIPTGMAHGTVTVIAGRGAHRMPIEVTTYRGDGAYVDGRRPTSVVFGVPLTEDLARRDLVVNAIAYDPVHARLIDPFDGRGDLAARRLRAVGDPAARFAEDGLRIMRAIRFAATLGFALDDDTTAAIPGALPSLAKVSRERVKVELDKLLGAPAPGAALTIARATGVLAQELPEATVDDAAWPARLAWLERAPAEARLAVLVAGGPDGEASAAAAERALRRLKAANDERDRAVRLVRLAHHADPTERVVRRALARCGRAHAALAVALWQARGDAAPAVADAGAAILGRGDALNAGELALTGAALIAALGLTPGPAVGRALAACLEAVLDEPTRNQPEALVAIARAHLDGGATPA